MKVAVIQLNAAKDKERNIEKAIDCVKKAILKKADFILLPEVFNFRGVNVKKASEKIPGETLLPLLKLAYKYNVFILAGSIYERIKGSEKLYNTSVLIDNQGKVKVKYRKIHLFNAVIKNKKIFESKKFLSGKRGVLAQVNEFNVGLSVCYDLRFSEMYRKYALKGADILCVPSAFTHETGKFHWEVLLRARAIENTCYVLAPNQVGKDAQGVRSYGNSMIIDPWGKVLVRASGRDEGIIYANIDKNFLIEKKMFFGRKG